MTRSLTSLSETRRCCLMASPTWSPTVKTGLREVIGSWKIMEISLPRTSCISSSLDSARSRPSNQTRPATIRPVRGSSRMMESAVTLLPQPDSPTSPSVVPRLTE